MTGQQASSGLTEQSAAPPPFSAVIMLHSPAMQFKVDKNGLVTTYNGGNNLGGSQECDSSSNIYKFKKTFFLFYKKHDFNRHLDGFLDDPPTFPWNDHRTRTNAKLRNPINFGNKVLEFESNKRFLEALFYVSAKHMKVSQVGS